MSADPPAESPAPPQRDGSNAAPITNGDTPSSRPDSELRPARSAKQHALSFLDYVIEAGVPGTKEQPWPKKLKPFAGALIFALLMAATGYGGSLMYDLTTADKRVPVEESARQKHDQEKEAFVAAIRYENDGGDFWRVILDRPLTLEEQKVIQSMQADAVWKFMEPLGARRVWYPSEVAAISSARASSVLPDATTFMMNIVSDRTTQLAIIHMHAVNVACHASTAQTVIDYPPQGGAAYEGVFFDLAQDDPIPYIADGDPEAWGRPYFSQRKIDLGGGMSPGGLRVEALAWEKSCEWEIEATYHDSSAEGGGTITLNDGGKPFFAEARPRNPAQYWIYSASTFPPLTPSGLIPCHELPTVGECPGRYRSNR